MVIGSQHSVVRIRNQAVKLVVLRKLSLCHPLVNEAQSVRHRTELIVQPVALLFIQIPAVHARHDTRQAGADWYVGFLRAAGVIARRLDSVSEGGVRQAELRPAAVN